MTLRERITHFEKQIRGLDAEIAKLHANRLRTEGALMFARQLVAEEAATAAKSVPPAPTPSIAVCRQDNQQSGERRPDQQADTHIVTHARALPDVDAVVSGH